MLALSTGGIIALAIAAAVVLVVVFALIPYLRRAKGARRLQARRNEVAGRHRGEAEARHARAERAELEAQRARAEAEMHEQEATLHERGLADERLGDPEDARAR
jgi:hypothetical protein